MRVAIAGHRLVHGVVEQLGDEVVQGAAVGAADIHAGAAADRLEAFEHLDLGGVVVVAAGSALTQIQKVCHCRPVILRSHACRPCA